MERRRRVDERSEYQQRALKDALLPPFTGMLLGGAVGAVLAAFRVANADLLLLIGGGAVVGTVGGVMLAVSRGLRLRAPGGTDSRR